MPSPVVMSNRVWWSIHSRAEWAIKNVIRSELKVKKHLNRRLKKRKNDFSKKEPADVIEFQIIFSHVTVFSSKKLFDNKRKSAAWDMPIKRHLLPSRTFQSDGDGSASVKQKNDFRKLTCCIRSQRMVSELVQIGCIITSVCSRVLFFACASLKQEPFLYAIHHLIYQTVFYKRVAGTWMKKVGLKSMFSSTFSW